TPHPTPAERAACRILFTALTWRNVLACSCVCCDRRRVPRRVRVPKRTTHGPKPTTPARVRLSVGCATAELRSRVPCGLLLGRRHARCRAVVRRPRADDARLDPRYGRSEVAEELWDDRLFE